MNKTETKSTVLLKHHLKALKLPTMTAECEKVAQRAAADNADHLAFLLQLCELELLERERKAAERRLKAARFPAAKLLDEFDFTARPSVNKPLMLDLVKGEYLDRRENILLVGPSGTGKSHLATALGMAACAQGRKVRFFRVTELITLLSGSQGRTTTLAIAAATWQASRPRTPNGPQRTAVESPTEPDRHRRRTALPQNRRSAAKQSLLASAVAGLSSGRCSLWE